MKKYALIFLHLALATAAFSQSDLSPYRNKTASQISNTAHLQKMDTVFFRVRIGDKVRDLTSAIEKFGIKPNDVSAGTAQAAKDTARARNFPFLFPATSSAASLDFKNGDSTLVAVIRQQINITSTDTIPAGACIFLEQKGKINISSGQVLYIDGYFDAPVNKRAFMGAGRVVFRQGSVKAVYAEWWGARNDSTGDSGTALKAALDAMPNGASLELLGDNENLQSSKGYIVNTTVRLPSRKNTVIHGNGAVIYSSAADTVLLLQNGSQTTIPSFAISPAVNQPRHRIDGIRFKRVASSLATGFAIGAINTTGFSISNCDFYNYKNAIVYNNQSSGWCENNDVFNCRIVGVDTAILYKVTLSGNNSFATNSLRKVTITGFDSTNARFGVGIYSNAGSNLYRNVWDNVVVFPRDSVTCFYIGGKAEDLTGSASIEYIGGAERTKMKGFHFGSGASELRFKLHLNITGRQFFDEPNLFFSEIPGSFGYSGITTTLDGNHNHGNETVVDSAKFTPIFGIIKNPRLGMASPGDSARIVFANVNNSGVGKLDVRAQRSKPIEIRSYTDNTSSAATGTTVRGSALPLQPVGLLDIGATRSVNDSATIDVRLATHLIISDNDNDIDSLTAFKGGIVGHTLTVTFSTDSVLLANLIGGTGSGRLFLLENRSTRTQTGMKSYFKCESETGGVFWREMWRSAEYGKTTDYTSVVDSIDVSQVNYIRFNRSVLGNIRNFYNGIDGQMITTLDRTGNSTYLHLGKGTTKGISLIGAANRRDSSGVRHIFVYDGAEDLWREISLSSNTNPGGGGGWNDSGNLIAETTTTDNVAIGDANNLAKLTIDGDANEVQFYIRGHSTQTASTATFTTSADARLVTIGETSGTGVLTMDSDGVVTIGSNTVPAGFLNGILIENGTAPTNAPTGGFAIYSLSGEPVIKDANDSVSKLTHAWGALYMSNATNVISTSGTAGTWVKVTNFTDETSPAGQGITTDAASDSLTVQVAGTYEINVSMSFHGGTASTDNYKIAVAKNGVVNTNYQAAATTIDNSSIVCVSFTGYYTAIALDDYSLVMTNNTDGDDPTIKQCSFTIKRIN